MIPHLSIFIIFIVFVLYDFVAVLLLLPLLHHLCDDGRGQLLTFCVNVVYPAHVAIQVGLIGKLLGAALLRTCVWLYALVLGNVRLQRCWVCESFVAARPGTEVQLFSRVRTLMGTPIGSETKSLAAELTVMENTFRTTLLIDAAVSSAAAYQWPYDGRGPGSVTVDVCQ